MSICRLPIGGNKEDSASLNRDRTIGEVSRGTRLYAITPMLRRYILYDGNCSKIVLVRYLIRPLEWNMLSKVNIL